jgi:hypothetical protein
MSDNEESRKRQRDEHELGMGQVIHVPGIAYRECEGDGCQKPPEFNILSESKNGRYCKEHKLPDMVNVINNRCLEEGCLKFSSYNFKGEKKKKYCRDHKEEGMVDVRSKLCEDVDCTKQPSYNFAGEKKKRFCKMHKQDEMIDVVHSVCEYEST